jgi:ABC-type transporter Mla subunit MlaD
MLRNIRDGLQCVLIAALVMGVAIGIRIERRDAAATSWNMRTAAWNLAQASTDLAIVTGDLADKRTGIARTLRNVNTVTAQVGRTSNVARLAASEQRAYLETASKETVATLRMVNGLVADAGKRINEGALPAATADLVALGETLRSLQEHSAALMDESTKTMKQAGTVLSDENIPAAMKSLASASGHVDGTARNLETTTGYVRDMFTPTKQSFWKTVVLSNLPPILLHLLPQRVAVTNTVKTEEGK